MTVRDFIFKLNRDDILYISVYDHVARHNENNKILVDNRPKSDFLANVSDSILNSEVLYFFTSVLPDIVCTKIELYVSMD